jgi:hypothetical protein
MKLLSSALLAAGLVALSACGGGAENTAANNVGDEVYNVAPDDLGSDNLLGNEALGNEAADANASADNASADNAAGNAQ